MTTAELVKADGSFQRGDSGSGAPISSGDAAKGKLESEKLQAEIDELRFRVSSGRELADAERSRKFRNTWIAWIGLITGIVTIAGGAWGLYLQVRNHLTEHDVKVTEQMIKLVAGLDSSKTDWERESSALLLASYEMDSVRVLVWGLARLQDPTAAIDSLFSLGKGSGSRQREVADALLQAAQTAFERESRRLKSDEGVLAVRNYIIAIGRLAKSRSNEATALLDRWRADLENPNTEISDVRRAGLKKLAETTRKRLQE